MEKIVQTAGRGTLGEFAPEFAHFNDDVLFGENWILHSNIICRMQRIMALHREK